MSRKNNVNADRYKTAGGGRPWEGAADTRKQPSAQSEADAPRGRATSLPGARARRLAEMSMGKLRRRRRLRRLSRLKGLTAKQLSERRMRLRQSQYG
jgi:hypothetical protein